MITFIVGASGSGKSTLTDKLFEYYDEVIEVDEVTRRLNTTEEYIEFLRGIDEKLVNGLLVDKRYLFEIFKTKPILKEYIENHIFINYYLPIITECRNKGKDLLIDGVLPYEKFLRYADQVVTVSVPVEQRIENLKKRGVPDKIIEDILEIQKNIF